MIMFQESGNFTTKKVLYIDPLSPNGHINFNRIYIEALLTQFEVVDFAFKIGYEKKLPIPPKSKLYSIPDKYYSKSNNKILNRINFFKINKYIEKICDLNQYDIVIFSSYEEISLYMSFYKKTLILINHNNLSALNNPIKFFIFKKLAKKNINIVFENYMKVALNEKGIENTLVIHHGLPSPFSTNILNDSTLKSKFAFLDNYKFVIFAPSGSSSDKIFLSNLISNEMFLAYLKGNDILFIVKNKTLKSNHDNICIIDNYLTDIQYQYLFLVSNIILILYPKAFEFRVSAVLFEAMCNNKVCILSDILALKNYTNYFSYNPFYRNIEELMKKISFIIELPDVDKINPYKDIFKLHPDFSKLQDYINIRS